MTRESKSNFDQAAAARAALEGDVPTRLRISVRALRALLDDPNDTEQAFLIGLAANAHRFPDFLARFATDDGGARLLRDQPTIDSESVDFEALRALPEDTLGGAYVRFLDENGLDPDLFQAPPGLPAIPAYISKRVRQSHDLWHVLTGYGTDVQSELALQAFTWRVTGMPGSGMIAFGGALRYMLDNGYRGVFRDVIRGARRGKKVAFLPAVVWEDHWARPLDDVRADLGIEPVPSRDVR